MRTSTGHLIRLTRNGGNTRIGEFDNGIASVAESESSVFVLTDNGLLYEFQNGEKNPIIVHRDVRMIAHNEANQSFVIIKPEKLLLRYLRPEHNKVDRIIHRRTRNVTAICVSTCGRFLAVGYRDGKIQILGLDKNETVAEFQNDQEITTLIFSDNSQRLIAGSVSGVISQYYLGTNVVFSGVNLDHTMMRKVVIDEQGIMILGESDDIWMASPDCLWRFTKLSTSDIGEKITDIAFDSGRLFVLVDGELVTVDTATGQKKRTIRVKQSTRIAVAKDRAVFCKADGLITVIDLTTSSQIARDKAVEAEPTSITFLQDASKLAIVDKNGVLTVLSVHLEPVLQTENVRTAHSCDDGTLLVTRLNGIVEHILCNALQNESRILTQAVVEGQLLEAIPIETNRRFLALDKAGYLSIYDWKTGIRLLAINQQLAARPDPVINQAWYSSSHGVFGLSNSRAIHQWSFANTLSQGQSILHHQD